MDEAERKCAAVRYDCMKWAVQKAVPGDDPMMAIALAQLYADFILSERVTTFEGDFIRYHPNNLAK